MRQQLKETNLDAVGQNSDSIQANRKRSLDDTDEVADAHPNKRSRECTPDDDSHNSSAEQGLKPTGISAADGISPNVSDSEACSEPAHTPGTPNGPGSELSPQTENIKLCLPLDLTVKLDVGGPRQMRSMTIPVELEMNVQTGWYQLSSPSPIVITRVAAPKDFSPYQYLPPNPGFPKDHDSSEDSPASEDSPEDTSEGSDSPKSSDGSEDLDSQKGPDLPEGSGCPDISSCSEGSESPSDPNNCHTPTVETHDSDHSASPQNLETTTGGNEDGSSQTLKKKRSREQLEDDVSNKPHATTDSAPSLTEPTSSDEKDAAEGQPEKKRPRDNSEERKTKVDQASLASILRNRSLFTANTRLLADLHRERVWTGFCWLAFCFESL
jgi:hypothetical protein